MKKDYIVNGLLKVLLDNFNNNNPYHYFPEKSILSYGCDNITKTLIYNEVTLQWYIKVLFLNEKGQWKDTKSFYDLENAGKLNRFKRDLQWIMQEKHIWDEKTKKENASSILAALEPKTIHGNPV